MINIDTDKYIDNAVNFLTNTIGETATFVLLLIIAIACCIGMLWLIIKFLAFLIKRRIRLDTWEMDYQAKRTAEELYKLQQINKEPIAPDLEEIMTEVDKSINP